MANDNGIDELVGEERTLEDRLVFEQSGYEDCLIKGRKKNNPYLDIFYDELEQLGVDYRTLQNAVNTMPAGNEQQEIILALLTGVENGGRIDLPSKIKGFPKVLLENLNLRVHHSVEPLSGNKITTLKIESARIVGVKDAKTRKRNRKGLTTLHEIQYQYDIPRRTITIGRDGIQIAAETPFQRLHAQIIPVDTGSTVNPLAPAKGGRTMHTSGGGGSSE